MTKDNPDQKKRRSWSFGMAFVAFVGALVFGPRMDGPRYINGVRFTTKTGGDGLTDWGWILLIVLPLLAFFITQLVFVLKDSRKKS